MTKQLPLIAAILLSGVACAHASGGRATRSFTLVFQGEGGEYVGYLDRESKEKHNAEKCYDVVQIGNRHLDGKLVEISSKMVVENVSVPGVVITSVNGRPPSMMLCHLGTIYADKYKVLNESPGAR